MIRILRSLRWRGDTSDISAGTSEPDEVSPAGSFNSGSGQMSEGPGRTKWTIHVRF